MAKSSGPELTYKQRIEKMLQEQVRRNPIAAAGLISSKKYAHLIPSEEQRRIIIRTLNEMTQEGAAKKDKLHKPPAHLLVSAAKFVLSRAAYQRYIEPQILDIRTEHYEALQAGELRKARWIVIRGYWQALRPLAVAAWGTITALLKMST